VNSIFLGDTITMYKAIGDDETFITGKVTGIVTHDETGRVKYLNDYGNRATNLVERQLEIRRGRRGRRCLDSI